MIGGPRVDSAYLRAWAARARFRFQTMRSWRDILDMLKSAAETCMSGVFFATKKLAHLVGLSVGNSANHRWTTVRVHLKNLMNNSG